MPRNDVKSLLLFFSAYYFSQGIYNAYSSFEQPFLRSYGIGLTDIATSKAVAKIPWSVKILMAIPTDYVGRRLPFVLCGMVLGASCLASISGQSPGGDNYKAYVATVFLRNLGIAFSDVAVDGMSVDSNLEAMAGTVQGAMSMGRVTGTLIGSAVGGAIVGKAGYTSMILFLAACIICIAPAACFVREEKGPKSSGAVFEWAAFHALLQRPVLAFLAYACIGNFAPVLAGTAGTEWAQTRLGFTGEEFGYLATVGSIGDMVGAVGTGLLFDQPWMDRRKVMVASCALSSATTAVQVWITDKAGWYALAFFSGIASGSLFVTNCGTVMCIADKRLGASVFAIAVSLMNFSQLAADAAGGPLAEIGLVTTFWVSFAVNLLQLLCVPFVDMGVPGSSKHHGSGDVGEVVQPLHATTTPVDKSAGGSEESVCTPGLTTGSPSPSPSAGAGKVHVANPYVPLIQPQMVKEELLEPTAAQVLSGRLAAALNRSAALADTRFAPLAPSAPPRPALAGAHDHHMLSATAAALHRLETVKSRPA